MKQVLIVLLMVFSTSTFADGLATKRLANKKAVKQFVSQVMDVAGSGQTVKALQMLKPHLRIPDSEFNMSLKMQESQQSIIKERFGNVLGSELITIEAVGDSLMHAIFIQKYERHLMTWNLFFYKPKNSWIINNYNTSDKVQTIFER
jgi:hypothetical protein